MFCDSESSVLILSVEKKSQNSIGLISRESLCLTVGKGHALYSSQIPCCIQRTGTHNFLTQLLRKAIV